MYRNILGNVIYKQVTEIFHGRMENRDHSDISKDVWYHAVPRLIATNAGDIASMAWLSLIRLLEVKSFEGK
jgi:hypothetical protein